VIVRAAILLLLAGSAFAQMRPTPGAADPRLQTVRYDAGQVVELDVAQGYTLMVAFSPGERVETVAVGDNSAWQVTPNKRGDAVFIKAASNAGPTNLTVVSDVRSYAFQLTRLDGAGAETAYVVRFTYDPVVPVLTGDSAGSEPATRYRIRGTREIRPDSVSDDGARTFVSWPPKATMPAIFIVDDDGAETLVNGAMEQGRFVIVGVYKKLIFRLDHATASAERIGHKR
jgi:type IV secretion system protein VirB9